MSDAAHDRLTVEQFYQWLGAVDGRWELVDGQPVIMAGATNRHDRLVSNALIYVGTHLRGHPCQPFTADIYYLSPEVLTGSKGAVWPLDGSPPSCVDEPVQWKDGFAPIPVTSNDWQRAWKRTLRTTRDTNVLHHPVFGRQI